MHALATCRLPLPECSPAAAFPWLQVTNPPIDPLREGLVMSLNMRLGARGNLLQPGGDAYRQISLDSPVLLETDLAAIKAQTEVKTKVCHLATHASVLQDVLRSVACGSGRVHKRQRV